jgi:hypothetical protein
VVVQKRGEGREGRESRGELLKEAGELGVA